VKLLLDINVILDVALNRAPFAEDSAKLLNAVQLGRAEGDSSRLTRSRRRST
jgi:hypothetical protein